MPTALELADLHHQHVALGRAALADRLDGVVKDAEAMLADKTRDRLGEPAAHMEGLGNDTGEDAAWPDEPMNGRKRCGADMASGEGAGGDGRIIEMVAQGKRLQEVCRDQ